MSVSPSTFRISVFIPKLLVLYQSSDYLYYAGDIVRIGDTSFFDIQTQSGVAVTVFLLRDKVILPAKLVSFVLLDNSIIYNSNTVITLVLKASV